ncbi:MAG: protein TolQ [Thermodesulfobacteriota bacterium]|nr:protein TolQ [Thermodesulfobacteriota bacterium]
MSAKLDLMAMILNAGFMVQFVLLLLLFFSVTSWAIIILKYRYLRRALAESATFTEYFWKKRDFTEAFSQAKHLQASPVARVFRAGYTEFKRFSMQGAKAGGDAAEINGFDMPMITSIERALQRGISAEMSKLNQLVPFLATTGNTTPFIGLFGTVWGIMNSFHGIGERGSASLAVVAPGISEALVATAAGLAAAIPAVVAFNYFNQRIRSVESEMRNFAADFLNIIERQARQAKAGQRGQR